MFDVCVAGRDVTLRREPAGPSPRALSIHSAADRGFTLIETLVVLLILAVLSGVALYAFSDVTKESASATCASTYKTLELAAETFHAQVGHYPPSIESMMTSQPGADQGSVGPWLKDQPPIYAALPAPAISGGAPYGFAVDPSTSMIGVATIQSNGANSSKPFLDGVANCAYA